MINMDSADEKLITAGCAGGLRSNFVLPVVREAQTGTALKVKVKGLFGGHSGEDIHRGRANANKLMGRALLALGDADYRIACISGGGKANAIPRECSVSLKTNEPDAIIDIFRKIEKEIAFELGEYDSDFEIACEVTDSDIEAFDRETTEKAVSFLATVSNGVLEMSKKIKGFVEYSRNLGIISTEGDEIIFTFFARSGIDAQLYASNREIEAFAKVYGARVEYMEIYGGWAYNERSVLRNEYAAAYKKTTGKDLNIIQIHAGLECGFISAKIPDADIISVGPNVYSLHSPDESMDLDSVETLFSVIKELLSN
jgi:dipeptidase D